TKLSLHRHTARSECGCKNINYSRNKDCTMTMKPTLLAMALSGVLASGAQASLVISEYVEDSGNNKAVELLNTGDTTVELSCGADATLISAIQGETDSSPRADQHVVIEAVVTAVFNEAGGLGGLFVQEEAKGRDSNPATSEGLFVYAPSLSAAPGQRLRLAGEVTEYNGLTELTNLTGTENCGTTDLPA